MANLNLPLDKTLLQRVDVARGKQPRVSWIRDAIEDKLDRRLPADVAEALESGPVTLTPVSGRPAELEEVLKPKAAKCTHNPIYKNQAGVCVVCERES